MSENVLVLNTTARPFIINAFSKKTNAIFKCRIPPGVCKVDKKRWNLAKSTDFAKELLENGDLKEVEAGDKALKNAPESESTSKVTSLGDDGKVESGGAQPKPSDDI